jgi:hypothetical protein
MDRIQDLGSGSATLIGRCRTSMLLILEIEKNTNTFPRELEMTIPFSPMSDLPFNGDVQVLIVALCRCRTRTRCPPTTESGSDTRPAAQRARGPRPGQRVNPQVRLALSFPFTKDQGQVKSVPRSAYETPCTRLLRGGHRNGDHTVGVARLTPGTALPRPINLRENISTIFSLYARYIKITFLEGCIHIRKHLPFTLPTSSQCIPWCLICPTESGSGESNLYSLHIFPLYRYCFVSVKTFCFLL